MPERREPELRQGRLFAAAREGSGKASERETAAPASGELARRDIPVTRERDTAEDHDTPAPAARASAVPAGAERTNRAFPPDLLPAERDALRSELRMWFARAKRDLPWRRDRDPYRVWVSEAMLQQTRVATVIPYYERFLARFPSARALAEAPIEDVLAAWSGLGYYRRARALHAAARAIVERHDGRFPDTLEAALALPGIGRYTAGAVSSIAFDRSEPLVDGNVARVFARLFGLAADPSSKSFADELWRRARDLVPAQGAGEWNQALMELGALVCTPRDPVCATCPLARRCVAFAEDRVDELPWPKARPSAIDVELLVLFVVDAGRLLLEQNPARGRMAEMWQLPTLEEPPAKNGGSGETRLYPRGWGGAVERSDAVLRVGRASEHSDLGTVRHTITRHRIRARVVRGELVVATPPAPFAWIDRDAIGALPLTGMTRKILRAPFLPGAQRIGARSSRDA